MKRNTVLTAAITIALTSLSVSHHAHAQSWWEKASGLFSKSESEQTQATQKDQAQTSTDQINIAQFGSDDLAAAFKQALKIGSEKVVSQLGQTDGFNADSAIRIPLPKELVKVKSILAKVGMENLVDDLEVKLNRAAEAATPKAKALFVQSIQDMSFNDVQSIYKGDKDSATQYFQQKMSASLSAEMRPIIESSLAQVGAVQAFDKVMGEYKDIPFVSKVKTDITEHVVNKGMDGIFHYIAKEEQAIRENPAEQTTALLKKVFGL